MQCFSKRDALLHGSESLRAFVKMQVPGLHPGSNELESLGEMLKNLHFNKHPR